MSQVRVVDRKCQLCFWEEGGRCYLPPVDREPDGMSKKHALTECASFTRNPPTPEPHRRFTLVGEGSLRGDRDGAWTTYRHLEEKVIAERVRIRRELETWAAKEIAQVGWLNSSAFAAALNRACPESESK